MEKLVKIESLASTGNGVGRIEVDGFVRAVFVPYTAPGDIVWVKITQQHKKYYEGMAKRYVSPSKVRSRKGCKHYRRCGACNLLHIEYDTQVAEKLKISSQILRRNDITADINVIQGEQFNYRYKAKVFLESQDGTLICGFRKARSHDVIQVTECRIVHPSILSVIQKINEAHLHFEKSYVADCIVDMQTDDAVLYVKTEDDVTFLDEALDVPVVNKGNYGDHVFWYEIEGARYFYNPGSFVQANLSLNQKLVQTVASEVNSMGENLKVLDLYSGNGNLSLGLNHNVMCVEGDHDSLTMLDRGLVHNGHKAEVVRGDVREYEPGPCDVVIVDPPREGSGIADKLIAVKPKLIIYVSCALQQSVKDIKQFIKSGYKLERAYLLDMFPNTQHFEFVSVLKA